MSTKPPLFDDITKLAGSVIDSTVHTALDTKGQLEKWLDHKCQDFLKKQQVVTREEFDVLKQLLQKTIQENENLKQRLQQLEQGK